MWRGAGWCRVAAALLLGLAIAVPGARAAPAEAAAPANDMRTLRIELSLGPCEDGCRVYRIAIAGSGAVEFDGLSNTFVLGRHHAQVDPAAVRALAQRFREVDFFNLPDSWPAGPSDNPPWSLAFTLAGRSKRIAVAEGEAANLPEPIAELEAAVIAASGADRWIMGSSETVPGLLAEGFDFHSPAAAVMLATAVDDQQPELVRALLGAGAPADASNNGVSAIETAAGKGDVEIWRALVEAGALRGASRERLTRIADAAVVEGNAEILRALLAMGADPNGPDEDVFLADAAVGSCTEAECGRLEILRLLIAAGADPNRSDNQGLTPIFYVRGVPMARLLLDSGANVNLNPGFDGPAILRLDGRDEDLALFLLERGADPSIRNGHGQDLADRARANGWQRVLARLGQASN